MRDQIQICLRELWGWTFGGLPGWLVNPGFRTRWSTPVVIEHFPADLDKFGLPETGHRVDVELASDLCLKRDLHVPRAAAKNLKQVVDVQVRQSMPNSASDLLWGYSANPETGNTVVATIYLIKKHMAEAVEKAAARENKQLRVMRVQLPDGAPTLIDRRSGADRAPWLWAFFSIMLVAIGVAYVAVANLTISYRLEQRTHDLQKRHDELSQQAIELRNAKDAAENNAEALYRDIDRFLTENQRLSNLLDLTEVLPDDVWLSELTIDGLQLRIAGFSGQDVADIMDLVRDLPWVSSITLNGSIAFDTITRKNRFDLVVQLKHHGVTGE